MTVYMVDPSVPLSGTIELKEMVEIIGTLYEMEGVNSETAGTNESREDKNLFLKGLSQDIFRSYSQ